jgi:pilus assembly protein CpaB
MQGSSKAAAAKFGALGFLVLGLVCAALAAFLVGNLMEGKYTGVRVTPILVARGELSAGTRVTAEDLELRDWPEDAVPEGAFGSLEAFTAEHNRATVTVGILPGEPVVATRLASAKNGAGVAPLVHPNMRAIALKVDDALGFTGLVYPGAYVDVVATVRDPQGAGHASRIAVQRAKVLSVGMDVDVATRGSQENREERLTSAQSSGGTFVTLEVTPEDAEVISVARNAGVIDLVLRNASDEAVVETYGANPTRFTVRTPPPVAAQVAGVDAPPEIVEEPAVKKKARASNDDNRKNDRTAPVGEIETYHAK